MFAVFLEFYCQYTVQRTHCQMEMTNAQKKNHKIKNKNPFIPPQDGEILMGQSWCLIAEDLAYSYRAGT